MSFIQKTVSQAVINYQASLKTMSALSLWNKTFNFNTFDHPKMGLYQDDMLADTPASKEAIRRLPREVRELRDFRISRAYQLSMNKAILPQEDWIKMEDDVPYLSPYVDLVLKEMKEKKEWALK